MHPRRSPGTVEDAGAIMDYVAHLDTDADDPVGVTWTTRYPLSGEKSVSRRQPIDE